LESFSHFREDIFCRGGQRKPYELPFTPAFEVIKALSFEDFEAAQKTNRLLATGTEEQVHYTSPNRDSTNNTTLANLAQCKHKHTATVTKPVASQVFISRRPETTGHPDPQFKRLSP